MEESTQSEIKDVIILVNEGKDNKHFVYRQGGSAERKNLETVFVKKFGFSQLNTCFFDGDICLGDWDHDNRPKSTHTLNASCCIKCLIKTAKKGEDMKRENNLLVVAICSHGGGDKDGDYISLVGKDVEEKLPLNDLFGFLRNCETLKNKTVIVLLEMCRGSLEDSGQSVAICAEVSDNEEEGPNEHPTVVKPETIQFTDIPDNCLVVYGTTPGLVSYRDSTKGSWMEQALLEEVEQHEKIHPGEDINFLKLLTRIAANVARRQTSNTEHNVGVMPEAGSSGKKCVIQSEHQLTRRLILKFKTS